MTICEICLCTIQPHAGRYDYEDGAVACLSCAMGGEDFSEQQEQPEGEF